MFAGAIAIFETTSMRLPCAAIAMLSATLAPALAFDDKQFCVAAQQVAIAAERDIGIWIDRVTRNAGLSVACDKKSPSSHGSRTSRQLL